MLFPPGSVRLCSIGHCAQRRPLTLLLTHSCGRSASQPQFNLQVREARSVWLLLNRHMSQIRAPGDTSPPRDFIGLRVFETEGASGVEPLQHTVSRLLHVKA